MKRWTLLLVLLLLPLTLAPRTATEPAPTGDDLTSAVVVRDAGNPGGTVPVQIRVGNGTATDYRTARVRITASGANVSVLGSSHGCAPAPDTQWPLVCTVNLPAGTSRLLNVVLRAPSTGVGTVNAAVSHS